MGGEELFQHLKICAGTPLFQDHYKIKQSGCLDLCKHGPTIWVKRDGIKYGAVTHLIGNLILEHHLQTKKPMKELYYKKSKKKK
jgi:(2Fe-2S) ferredoxin